MTKIFSKTLSKTDTQKRLAIPSKNMRFLPRLTSGEAMDLQVEDESGTLWHFRYSVRKVSYLKPVFSGDWCKFVRSNSLCVEDKIALYKEEDQSKGIKYKVKAKKAVKIFGVTFDYSCA